MIGALLIIVFFQFKAIMPLFVLLAKFGIGAAFGLIYIANFIFPIQFSS